MLIDTKKPPILREMIRQWIDTASYRLDTGGSLSALSNFS